MTRECFAQLSKGWRPRIVGDLVIKARMADENRGHLRFGVAPTN
jgi:hypothetical protein